MPQRIINIYNALDSDIAQAGGYAITGVSVWTVIMEWLARVEFNDVVQIIMFSLSALFMFFKACVTGLKAYNSYLDSKGKKLDNKIKRHQLKKIQEDEKSNG